MAPEIQWGVDTEPKRKGAQTTEATPWASCLHRAAPHCWFSVQSMCGPLGGQVLVSSMLFLCSKPDHGFHGAQN